MEKIKIENKYFYREIGFCTENQRKSLLKDVIKILDDDIKRKDFDINTIMPYQTRNNLYDIVKNKKYWLHFYNRLYRKLYNIYQKEFQLKQSWANLSKENNKFIFHRHEFDITCVYHLKNNNPEYGTNIENKVIIPAIENSLVIFKGNISHSICNMPKQIAKYKKNHRYSIVFDFDYEKK